MKGWLYVGNPLPEKSPDGTFSNFCWTSGAFFNPASPPDFLTIDVAGMLIGARWMPSFPGPPNGRFVLFQDTDETWILIGAIFFFGVAWNNVLTSFVINVSLPSGGTNFSAISSTCRTNLANSNTTPANSIYYGGSMRILGVN